MSFDRSFDLKDIRHHPQEQPYGILCRLMNFWIDSWLCQPSDHGYSTQQLRLQLEVNKEVLTKYFSFIYTRLILPPFGWMLSCNSQRSVPEVWHWIMARTFSAEYSDVKMHLTSDLLDIKCHNIIVLSYKALTLFIIVQLLYAFCCYITFYMAKPLLCSSSNYPLAEMPMANLGLSI